MIPTPWIRFHYPHFVTFTLQLLMCNQGEQVKMSVADPHSFLIFHKHSRSSFKFMKVDAVIYRRFKSRFVSKLSLTAAKPLKICDIQMVSICDHSFMKAVKCLKETGLHCCYLSPLGDPHHPSSLSIAFKWLTDWSADQWPSQSLFCDFVETGPLSLTMPDVLLNRISSRRTFHFQRGGRLCRVFFGHPRRSIPI